MSRGWFDYKDRHYIEKRAHAVLVTVRKEVVVTVRKEVQVPLFQTEAPVCKGTGVHAFHQRVGVET